MRKALSFALLLAALCVPARAATVNHLVATADTGATPNTSGSFTPTADALLVVFVVASGTTDTNPTLTSSLGSGVMSFVVDLNVSLNSSADKGYIFIAKAFATASSQTVTVDTPGDASTGTVIIVEEVVGVGKHSLAAVAHDGRTANQAGGGTPACTFGAGEAKNAHTLNPTLGVVANLSNPAGMTPPTDWTERADTGYASPTTGLEVVTRDSGFTGTTITWGGTSATAFAALCVEIDASCGGRVSLLGVGCR